MVETSLGYPLVIQMAEDALGRGTISSIADDLTQLRPTLRIRNPPHWLAVSGQNTPDLVLLAQFEQSPFAYEVLSVDDDHHTHTSHDFASVPCSHHTWCYTRLSKGFIRIPLTVQIGEDNETECFVEVQANYSIGKNALIGVLSCQP